LDSLSDQSASAVESGLKSAYPDISDLDASRLSGAPLSKLIKKVMTKFELEPQLAPRNLRQAKPGANVMIAFFSDFHPFCGQAENDMRKQMKNQQLLCLFHSPDKPLNS
jgi:hypothetical protein